MTPLADIVALILTVDDLDAHYVNGVENVDFAADSLLPAIKVEGPFVSVEDGDPSAVQRETFTLTISVPSSPRYYGTEDIDRATAISLAIRDVLDDNHVDPGTDQPLRHLGGQPVDNDYGVTQWADNYSLTRLISRCPL